MPRKSSKQRQSNSAVTKVKLAFQLLQDVARLEPHLSLTAVVSGGRLTADADIGGKPIPSQMTFEFGEADAVAAVQGLFANGSPGGQVQGNDPETESGNDGSTGPNQTLVNIDQRGSTLEQEDDEIAGPIVAVSKKKRTVSVELNGGVALLKVKDGVEQLLQLLGVIQGLSARREKGNNTKVPTYVVSQADVLSALKQQTEMHTEDESISEPPQEQLHFLETA